MDFSSPRFWISEELPFDLRAKDVMWGGGQAGVPVRVIRSELSWRLRTCRASA